MLQGILPDTSAVDPVVAKKTADKVWEIWPDEDIRGWGRPVLAINSARIGDPERAVYHLTAFDWWKFDDAGMFDTFHVSLSLRRSGSAKGILYILLITFV
jgi:hypothetical protein